MACVPYRHELSLCAEVELLLKKRSEGGGPAIIRCRPGRPFQRGKGEWKQAVGAGVGRPEMAGGGLMWRSANVRVCGSPGCSRREAPGDNIQVLTYKGHVCRTEFSTMQPFIWQPCTEKERQRTMRTSAWALDKMAFYLLHRRLKEKQNIK